MRIGEKFIFLLILLVILPIGFFAKESPVDNAMQGAGDLLSSYFKERDKRSPFKAGAEAGACYLGGLANQKYEFAECEGLTGQDLQKCCSKRTKADINATQAVSAMGVPAWMRDNPNFDQTFFEKN